MNDADKQPVAERPALAELRSDNLSQLVFESIRTAILNRTLAPGSRLTERKLTEELNVSKTPVREALVKLGEAGLIDPDGRRGGRVIRPSRTTPENAYVAANRLLSEKVEKAFAPIVTLHRRVVMSRMESAMDEIPSAGAEIE